METNSLKKKTNKCISYIIISLEKTKTEKLKVIK
jgi:hypothetical protein